MVFRRCLQMLGDEARAQDAVQEVFLSLVKNNERLKDGFPSSLLYRIATNICLNMLKREKKMTFKDDSFFTTIAAAANLQDTTEAKEMLARIFFGEKEDTAEIAVMRFIDRLSYEEIAEVSGLSVSGIRKRLAKLAEKAKDLKVEFYV